MAIVPPKQHEFVAMRRLMERSFGWYESGASRAPPPAIGTLRSLGGYHPRDIGEMELCQEPPRLHG
jgi:hypothetical protein